jgi:hypothetical protein
VVISIPDPKDFGFLVIFSFCVVTLGHSFYGVYAKRRSTLEEKASAKLEEVEGQGGPGLSHNLTDKVEDGFVHDKTCLDI